MQIQIGPILLCVTNLLVITAGFPGTGGVNGDSLNIDNYGISKTLRELTDIMKRSMSKIQESTSVKVPQVYATGVSKSEPATHVNTGTAQTTNILQLTTDTNEVGFHVSLGRTLQLSPDDGLIQFDTILESMPDITDGYYRDGIFTTPVSGTYLVSLTIASQDRKPIFVSVYMNEFSQKMSVITDGRGGISQGSVTSIIKLRRGDRLSVKSDRPSDGKVLGGKLSSWSVYMLNKA